MKLTYDRQLKISVGNSRKDMNWKAQTLSVGELWERLKTPARGTETISQYLALKKSQQDELKDVGGFMAGTLNGTRRKASAVIGRDIITLDFDTIPAYGTDGVIKTTDNLKCAYAIYSTRKHIETAPRLRVLIPLDRTVSADEYEPIARRVASLIGIQMADPTTFEASRLMFWPSCSADSAYIFTYKDAPLLKADDVLNSYTNWRDFSSWPQVPGAVSYQKLAMKQGDPDTKPGIVGAFNRAYGDVYRVIDELLPGIYEAVDNDPNRFTYLGGSTTGGAVVYNNGKFLYSHHATDPCTGKLVNCFDLVRLHKFGDKDDEAQPGTPINRMPSYTAMQEYVQTLDPVKRELFKSISGAADDFAGVSADGDPDPDAWALKLKLNKDGIPIPTIDNIMIILDGDPLLKGKFALNQFAGRGEVLGPLPWAMDGKRRLWSDTDSNGLYWYLEKTYAINKRGNIDAALDVHAATHAFNEVQDFLNSLSWDGIPRLDTLFIDYLGAEDDKEGYCRAVCRKAFTAAVARAMDPGCKFDQMLILCGPQGIGKSTLLDRMSRGWFNDSIRTFEGKETMELLPGVWIAEVAELDAFRRTEVSRIKQFLSLRTDRYRAAYGRNMKEQPRSCVFFGTCNQMDFLQDTTGNRRFWPVDVKGNETLHSKDVWRDLTDETVEQIWAEAKMRWQLGEQLYLTGDLEEAAREHQEMHRDVSPWEGIIKEFLDKKVPDDWSRWDLDHRRDFWAQNVQGGDYNLVPREKVTAIEIWCELFMSNKRDIKPNDRKEINACISHAKNWRPADKPFHAGVSYGTQRGFCNLTKILPNVLQRK